MDAEQHIKETKFIEKIEEVFPGEKWKEFRKKMEEAARKALGDLQSLDIFYEVWYVIHFMQVVKENPHCLNNIKDKKNPSVYDLDTSDVIIDNALQIPTGEQSRDLLNEALKIMLPSQ